MLASVMRKNRSDKALGAEIRRLQPGGCFTCYSKGERVRALTLATAMYQMEYIPFEVHSRDNGKGQFTIYRLG